jgi:ribosomal protein S7
MKYFIYKEGIFQSYFLSKFINKLPLPYKKFSIEKIIYFTFYLIKKNLKYYPLFIFFEVLEKIKPSIGLQIYKFQ